MQWRGGDQSAQGQPAPYRAVLDALQRKAAPYVQEYGDNWLPGAGGQLNNIFRGATEMVPGAGDLVGLEDLQTAAQNNDWGGIGLGLLAAIPGIPAIGKGVRGEARAARRGIGLMDAAPAQSPPIGLMGRTEADQALARYQAANPADTGARVLSPGDEGYPHNAQWDEASQAYVAPRVDVPPAEPDYPIRAYHGSPHSFDQFSLDAIGTGEGAQASLADIIADAEAQGVKLSVSEGNNGITLSRIVVPQGERSQGLGSAVMRALEGYADSTGSPIALTPSGDFGGSVPRLQQFYRRFGFAPNAGRTRDFSTRETMIRQPR